MPLDFMLVVMRDPAADHKRRDAMAMGAAPYLHSRLTAIDAKLSPGVPPSSPGHPNTGMGRSSHDGLPIFAAGLPQPLASLNQTSW